MRNAYDIGDLVNVTATFRDEDGELADPDTVVLTVLKPDGMATTVEAGSTVTGIWTGEISPDAHGTWRYRFAGTGAVKAAGEGAFNVRRRRVNQS